MKKSMFSLLGNALSVVGVALTPQELESVEHITAIICMIVGLLITIVCSIVIPFIKWWKKAKADGKITEEEVDELMDELHQNIDDKNKKGE